MLSLEGVYNIGAKCLVTRSKDLELWHRCLGHVNFDLNNKIFSNELVMSLPKIKLSKENLCDLFQMRNKIIESFKPSLFCSYKQTS